MFTLLIDLAGISTLEGVTAMPRKLHARLCHAFLVHGNIINDICKRDNAVAAVCVYVSQHSSVTVSHITQQCVDG